MNYVGPGVPYRMRISSNMYGLDATSYDEPLSEVER